MHRTIVTDFDIDLIPLVKNSKGNIGLITRHNLTKSEQTILNKRRREGLITRSNNGKKSRSNLAIDFKTNY